MNRMHVSLTKQAKPLNEKQERSVLSHIDDTRDAIRNRVMFLLSVDADLLAKELASGEWRMGLDADSKLTDVIRLENKSAKGSSSGVAYMRERLTSALSDLLAFSNPVSNIIKSKSGKSFSVAFMTNWFLLLYRDLDFEGCSSHSGIRTAITKSARTISQHNGSMRDVQALARHSLLQMTQRYLEVIEDAMKRVVR